MAVAPLLLLLSLPALLLLSSAAAQSASAPSPPAGPINITGILDRAGGYTSFIRLLNQTQAAVQIDNQVNNSRDGMTVFAPTDNAFTNLRAGALNDLSDQQQVQLVLYHICPKYYTLDSLRTVSNPVRTQASGQDGGVFGLNFTGAGSGVNVSTGVVSVPIYNAVRRDFPLAVYQVDQVLLPEEFYEARPPAPAPPSNNTRARGGGGNGVAPSAGNSSGNGCGKNVGLGMGLVGGFWVLCVAFFVI